jgi:hypothetical protein
VQLIEEPIEEIIIPDDPTDYDNANLETLIVEDIVAKDVDENEMRETPVEKPMDKVVDITQSVSTVLIDGNVEPGETVQQLVTAPIKITISKTNGTPKSSPKRSETSDAEKVDKFGESVDLNEQPPPPGEEMVTAPADLKPRLRERKLTEYPPVKRSHEESALCSIM